MFCVVVSATANTAAANGVVVDVDVDGDASQQ